MHSSSYLFSLAVQDSSIGDLFTRSLTNSLTDWLFNSVTFDYGVYNDYNDYNYYKDYNDYSEYNYYDDYNDYRDSD